MKKLAFISILFAAVVWADTEIPFPGDPGDPPIVTSLPFLSEVGGTGSDATDWVLDECTVVKQKTLGNGKIVKYLETDPCGGGGGGTECSSSPCSLNTSTTIAGVTICRSDGTNCQTFASRALASGDLVWGNGSEANLRWDFDPSGPVNPYFDFSTGQFTASNASFLFDMIPGSLFDVLDVDGDGVRYNPGTNEFRAVGNAKIIADLVLTPTPTVTVTPTPTESATPTATVTTTPYPTPTNVAILHGNNSFTNQNTFSFGAFLLSILSGSLQFGDQIEEKWINFDTTTDTLFPSGGAVLRATDLVCSADCVANSELTAISDRLKLPTAVCYEDEVNTFANTANFSEDVNFNKDVWFNIAGPAQGVRWNRTTKELYPDLGNGVYLRANKIENSVNLPATCVEGQIYQDTDSGNSETSICTATNTWSKLALSSEIVAETDPQVGSMAAGYCKGNVTSIECGNTIADIDLPSTITRDSEVPSLEVDGSVTNEIEVVDEAYSGANFNGGTTSAVSQDDFYDYAHIGDVDDDGLVEKIDTATNGFVKTTGGTGTLSIDTSTYLTAEVDGSTTNEIEVVDEAYSAANFNGATTQAVSQDDFYDLIHAGDADDDGKADILDTTSNGFVKTTGGTGAISIDTSTYLTTEVDGSTTNEIEVQDETYSSGNFNGDTTHGVSQDDFWDNIVDNSTTQSVAGEKTFTNGSTYFGSSSGPKLISTTTTGSIDVLKGYAVTYTNHSGVDIAAYRFVCPDTSNANSIVSCGISATNIIGVSAELITDTSTGRVIIIGYVPDMTCSGTFAIGNPVSSDTSGTAKVYTTGDIGGYALSTCSGGVMDVLVKPKQGKPNMPIWSQAATCNNATATTLWDFPTSGAATVTCDGTDNRRGVVNFADGSTQTAYFHVTIPNDWDGVSPAFNMRWYSSTSSTNNVYWSVSYVCTGSGEDIDPTFNASSDFASAGQASGGNVTHAARSAGTVTATNCSSGEILHVKVSRLGSNGSDTFAGTALVVGAIVTFNRF